MSCRASPDSRRRRKCGYAGITRTPFPVDGLPMVRSVNEDIKDYAENTMNELLGWYGYGKVGVTEAQGLDSRCPSSSSSSPLRTEGTSPPQSRTDDISDELSDQGSTHENTESEVLPMDAESGASNPNVTIICAWCHKKGLKLFTLKTSGGQYKTFCSELCFDQCRRAAFKKNRTCDWCKHIRHTVNYVDFQDKDHQLQFCSNKCLNQYKMNIFCKETQAYLQLHPPDSSGNSNPGCSRSNSPNLITPDLWMRDCKEMDTDGSDDEIMDKPDVKPELMTPPSPLTSNDERNTISDLSLGKKDKSPTETNYSSIAKTDLMKSMHERRRKKLQSVDTQLLSDLRSSRIRPVIPKPTLASTLFPTSNRSVHAESMLRSSSPTMTYAHPPMMNGFKPSRNSTSASSSAPSFGCPPGPLSQSGLPPPPPLLSADLFQSHFPPSQMYLPPRPFPPPQHQLDNYLSMHNNNRLRLGLPNHRTGFPELPINLSSAQSSNTPIIPPPPVSFTLPYPLVIPFPVPIPIPIPLPLSQFLEAKQYFEKGKATSSRTNTTEEQAKRVDNIISKLMTKHYAQKQNQESNVHNARDNGSSVADSSIDNEEDNQSGAPINGSMNKVKRKRTFDLIRDRSKRYKESDLNV